MHYENKVNKKSLKKKRKRKAHSWSVYIMIMKQKMKSIGYRINKLLDMYKSLSTSYDVDRLYVTITEGRGVINIENCIDYKRTSGLNMV